MYTVVIPSLGRQQYLIELIDSIQRQTQIPHEILLLLDDNPHCHQISESLRAYDCLKIIYCDLLNLAEKRNLGASLSTYENIIYSDDDDIWLPDKGEMVLNALTLAPVCCHNYGKFGARTSENCSKLGFISKKLSFLDLVLGSNLFGGGSAIAAKRYILLTFPFAPEFKYCEDFEWWSRVLLARVDVYYIVKMLVMYRTHASNMTSSRRQISYYDFKIASTHLQYSLLLFVSGVCTYIRALVRLFAFLWA